MQKTPNINLILDTHVFLWLIDGDSKLSTSSQKMIQKVIEHEGGIAISAISLWEIAMLSSKKCLLLNQPCLNWLNQGLQAPGIFVTELTPEIAEDSANLPAHFHGDPADRIIIASARALNVPLMTKDQKILDYGKEGLVKCIEA